MSEMTPLEKVNGCMALLIDLCMKDTNADTFNLKTSNVRYKGKLLGDYQLTIKRTRHAPTSGEGDINEYAHTKA